MQQIITLSEPFQSGSGPQNVESNSTRWKDIVIEVKRHATPPMRPPIPARACPPLMHELIEQCWDEDPGLRPNFVRIRAVIRKVIGKSGDNIVDHLVHRMNVHTSTLEHQVREQFAHFSEERQRTGELLKTILPRSVADAILQGRMVYPEKFDSVTIYVGSVLGFDEAINRKSASDVIKLVSQLYNVCDDVIAESNVYKVETVRDTYLLASGVPIRNGNRHAEEMAELALVLRKDVASISGFNSKLAKTKPFKLRAGLHTGPVVTGLVGHGAPRYCLFGDTITIANVLEKRGEAGKIHCSEATKALLEDLFVFMDRSHIETKDGLGKLTTFWLLGKD
ncbi:hypothetical protein RvY_04063-2 [Ramazzottius varieornatus]|nr:hypothetical protein RvY_04063-2 [Ramazzottius varieornatus]